MSDGEDENLELVVDENENDSQENDSAENEPNEDATDADQEQDQSGVK